MKRKGRWLGLLLAASMVISLTACGNTADEESADNSGQAAVSEEAAESGAAGGETGAEAQAETKDPFGKYEEPITVRTTMLTKSLKGLRDGVSLENNAVRDIFAEYGINMQYDIVADTDEDMTTKINMAIATDDLPDFLIVNATQFKDLLDADMLEDMTDYIDEYASDAIKDFLGQVDENQWKNVQKDGRTYGILSPVEYDDYVGVIAIRRDWMEQLGLEEPENLEDVWAIANTFQEHKMDGTCDIGIGLTKNVVDFRTPALFLLNAYHAYSNIWIEQDGQLVNSSIQPSMKEALAKLHEKYEEGLIDPEFGSKDQTKQMEDAVAGRTGVVVTKHTGPFSLLNGVKLGQDWAYYRMFSDDGEVVRAQQSVGFSEALVAIKGTEHPEAMLKLMNIFMKYMTEDPATYSDDAMNNFAYPFKSFYPNVNNKIHQEYLEYLESGEWPDSIYSGFDSTAEAAELWRNSQDPDGYTMWAVFGPEGTENAVDYALENGGYLVDMYTGPVTDNMSKYSANLKTMEEQMITYIITGQKPIDYFDEFVEDWKANGGDIITQEVNEWYQNNS